MATWYRNETLKLWRDMTPEEKGALLLAAHEGKVIENKGRRSGWIAETPYWNDLFAYRIRHEPTVEVVNLQVINNDNGWQASSKATGYTHSITFTTIDGVPDTGSIQMEKL